MRRAQDDNEIRIQQRDEQISALQKDIALMLSDYQDLLDVKVQLDTELQAYQKMLEQEESRSFFLLFFVIIANSSSNLKVAHHSFGNSKHINCWPAKHFASDHRSSDTRGTERNFEHCSPWSETSSPQPGRLCVRQKRQIVEGNSVTSG